MLQESDDESVVDLCTPTLLQALYDRESFKVYLIGDASSKPLRIYTGETQALAERFATHRSKRGGQTTSRMKDPRLICCITGIATRSESRALEDMIQGHRLPSGVAIDGEIGARISQAASEAKHARIQRMYRMLNATFASQERFRAPMTVHWFEPQYRFHHSSQPLLPPHVRECVATPYEKTWLYEQTKTLYRAKQAAARLRSSTSSKQETTEPTAAPATEPGSIPERLPARSAPSTRESPAEPLSPAGP